MKLQIIAAMSAVQLLTATVCESAPIRVLVWDERQPAQKEAYTNFLGNEIAAHLRKSADLSVLSAALDEPQQGLGGLDNFDVLIWWGHLRHNEIKPETARDIVQRVMEGRLALLVLHSAHWSQPFVEAMRQRARTDALAALAPAERAKAVFVETNLFSNYRTAPAYTTLRTPSVIYRKAPDRPVEIRLTIPNCCFPAYRPDGKPSQVRMLLPHHPVARGVPLDFTIPQTEMYDEPFHVPEPDAVVFEERWETGEWFRSGAAWNLGRGKVFYFRPGHELYPVFKNENVLRIIENTVRWLGAAKGSAPLAENEACFEIMKAIQLEKPQHFRCIDISEPAAPEPDEVLVRVHRIGICGTDFGGYLGKMPYFSYPRIPGHELGVEVLAIGSAVVNVKVGDRCSVEPYMNCQKCYSCRKGNGNCCENLKVIGVMIDGGMTERIVLPARKLHPANKLSAEQCALVETLAIGCHAINRANPQPGDSVLVIGAGPIGLSVIEFAKLSGAKTIVMDVNDQRLAFVREHMGVPHTLLVKGDGEDLKGLGELTCGQLADVVVDATGSNKSMGHALNYCAFGGRLVYVGITQQEVAFPHAPVMHRRELTLLASRNALAPDFARIITLIEVGQIDTRPWITHRADFDSMIGEFPNWLKPETGVIKAMVNLDT